MQLTSAESALATKLYADAIRAAERSIGIEDSATARQVIVLAYCALGDLERANASLRALSSSQRSAAVKRCAELGLSIME